MEFAGRYINMAASAERRLQMEEQFASLGIAHRYARFNAVDGRDVKDVSSTLSPAELGCFMSHYRCIVEGAEPEKHVHVVEDDVVFAPQTAPMLDSFSDPVMENCDILFLDIFVPVNVDVIFNFMTPYRQTGMIEAQHLDISQRMPHSIAFPELKTIGFAGATSYIVANHARHKIRRLLDQAINNGVTDPIDILFRKLVGTGDIKAQVTIPFLTSIRPDSITDTTMTDRGQDPASALALFLVRSQFFVGKDETYLRGLGQELTSQLADPGYADQVIDALRFVFSEKYVLF